MFKNKTVLYALLGALVLLLTACPATETPGDASYTLEVFINGDGTVTSDDGLIDCGADCEETYSTAPSPAIVTLTAIAADGYQFDEWSGVDCASGDPTGTDCSLTIDGEKDATANFSLIDDGPDPVDPVEVEITIGACEADSVCNDAEEFITGDRADDVLISSSDLELNYNSVDEGRFGSTLIGLRFVPSLELIPADATITSAYVQFTPKDSNEEDAAAPTITIRAETTESPTEFAPSDNNLSGRPVTESGVEWQPAPWEKDVVSEATRTPELVSLIEAVNWQPGGALVLLFENDGTQEMRNAFSGDPLKDEDGNEVENPKGPRLFVTYTLPSGS